mgnify:CR=1 FL=1
MRIGIITHSLSYNYGGILQNYALQTVLKRMGHTPITLNPNPHIPFSFRKWVCSFPKKFAYKYYLRLPRINLFEDFYANKVRKLVMTNLQPFIDKNICYKNVKDFQCLSNDDYDVLLAGSDQIWRPPYVSPIEKAFFNFAESWNNIKRISDAASFGTGDWEYSEEQEMNCKRLIKKFDAISVREESGVVLCKRYFGVNAVHVLDPTMLLLKDDYILIFQCSGTPKSSGTLLNYILDETDDKKTLIATIAKEKGLAPFRVNAKPEGGYPIKERIQPSIESWLRGFYDAEFVVTDSFHACVFSIIFNKPFVVYANRQRGYARFQSLLKQFGLEDRVIYDLKGYKEISSSIDWHHVNHIIMAKQSESYAFLHNVLN